MDTRLLAKLTQELANAICRETSLPSRRRWLEQTCSTTLLEGFRQIPRPQKESEDLTRRIDEWAEQLFLKDPRLLTTLGEFVVISEERGVLYYPSGFQPSPGRQFHLLMLDPVDNTELVIRRLGGAVTALVAAVQLDPDGTIERAELEAVAVADIAGGEVFFTGLDYETAIVSDGSREESACTRSSNQGRYSLSTILIKAERFHLLAPSLAELGENVGATPRFFLHHGGPLPLCRVAAGDLDVAFDLHKGHKTMDYAAGLWVADRCGCSWKVFDEFGEPMEDYDPGRLRIPQEETLERQLLEFLEQRTRFVVARSPELADLVVERFLS